MDLRAAFESLGSKELTSSPILSAVSLAISRALSVRSETIVLETELDQIASFNSFRMMDIVERVEAVCGISIPARDLSVSNLTNPAMLSEIVLGELQERFAADGVHE